MQSNDKKCTESAFKSVKQAIDQRTVTQSKSNPLMIT